MDTTDKTYWHKKLVDQRALLLSLDEDSKNSRNTVELDQTKVGRLSRMDALQEQAMNSAVSTRRKLELNRIEAALNRLQDDEFGFCIECGEDIHQKRLELDPSIAICVQCRC
ncbi:TraR/DksA family transcriptional regulator [Temperatibacter marinus]|uniref:TraR/DksA family transcriptional regulator n=1 Tax=Temperatibacter marinus TaxID=1456591 RepID=A0AA52EGV2_9PROT|nr:TraR/DksA family transcriptional regulator [Temperatibacter marinus]WND02269.1 TraR/DksA family transcriptional regulator [Temperatibacter marinus]